MKKQNTCPLCRKSLKNTQFNIAHEFRSQILEIPVVCTFPQCCWIGAMKCYNDHEEKCPFNPKNCKAEILDLLPKYDKNGEDDIETPCISLITKLYTEHPNIISEILKRDSTLKATKDEEYSTCKIFKKHKQNKKSKSICSGSQTKIEKYLKYEN